MTRTSLRPLYAAMTVILLGGCMAGPDFHRPDAQKAQGYLPSPPAATVATPGVAGGDAQRFASGADVPADWWTLFHCHALDDLVAQALRANPDIAAAQAALDVARENALAQRGALMPSVTANASASRQRTSKALSATPESGALSFSLVTPQVGVSYAPDVFGLNRRTLEGLQAQAQGARYARAAARLTLASNVAVAAIGEASLRAQIEATHELVAIQTQTLDLLRTQVTHGYASSVDVAAQEAQLAQTQAELPPLLKQLAQQRDLLVSLAGGFPDRDLPQTFTLDDFQLPHTLPLSLPSQLVEQRPDVRQAEENLHAANAQIGVAAANRLPQVQLTADLGATALTLGSLGSGGFWDLGAALAAPLFDGGTRRHEELAARAAHAQAAAQYQRTVHDAFREVADTLHAIEQDASTLQAATLARDAAAHSLRLAQAQVRAGEQGRLTLLAAQQGLQQATLAVVQAQAARYSDSVALFQALGGGWWDAPVPEN